MNRAKIFWIEVGCAAGSAILFFLTVVWPEWIEALTGLDPDRSSGALEWGLVLVLAATGTTFSLLARRQWRRLRVT